MSIRKLYLGTNTNASSQGSYLDLGLSTMGVSLSGTTFKVTASSGADTIFLRPSGYSFDFTGGNAADKIYLTGSYSDYTIATVTEGGVTWLKLTAGSGDTSETIRIVSTSATNLVFADGFNTVATISSLVSGGGSSVSLDASDTSQQPQSLSAGASAATVTDAAASNDSQTYITGGNTATITAIGNGQVDYVYVGQGGNVDATLLGLGEDVIYLEGTWGDYDKAVQGTQLILTRTVTDAYSGQEITESVIVSAGLGSANDRLIFRDGTVSSLAARTAVISDAEVTTSELGAAWSDDETSQSSVSDAASGLSLVDDSGVSSLDNVSSDGTVTVSGLIDGFRWQYSSDGGATWKNGGDDGTFTLADTEADADGTTYAVGDVQVRQINPFGVVSETVSNTVEITVDSTVSSVTDSGKYASIIVFGDVDGDGFVASGTGYSLTQGRGISTAWFRIDDSQVDGTYVLSKMVVADASGNQITLTLRLEISTDNDGLRTAYIVSETAGGATGSGIEVPIGEWFSAGLSVDANSLYSYVYAASSLNAGNTAGIDTAGFALTSPTIAATEILSVSYLSNESGNIEVKNPSVLDNQIAWFENVIENTYGVVDENNPDDNEARSNQTYGSEDGLVGDDQYGQAAMVSSEQIFSGTAEANATVTISWNGQEFTGKADADGNYAILVSFENENGESQSGVQQVAIVQKDLAGNTSDTVSMSVFVNANSLGYAKLADTSNTGSTFDTITSDQTPEISVKLPDSYDPETQTVTLYRVAEGASVSSGAALSASDISITDGVVTYTASTNWEGSADGTSYDVVAVLTLTEGGAIITQTRTTITIDTAAKAPVVDTSSVPTEINQTSFDAEGNYVIRGTAEAGSTAISLSFDDSDGATENPTFTGAVLADGSWTVTVSKAQFEANNIADGTVVFVATVTDAAGNIASSDPIETIVELTNNPVVVNEDVTIDAVVVSAGNVASKVTVLNLADLNGDGEADTTDTAFIDTDSAGSSNATLTYSATLLDGSALPSWLTITEDGKVQLAAGGTVPDLSSDPISITITATDGGGATASRNVQISTDNSISITSVLNDVGNVDVRSSLVITLGDAAAVGVEGGTITIRNLANDDSASGYNGENSTQADIVISTSGLTADEDGNIILSFDEDLDLANNYTIIISDGAFVNETTGGASAAVSSGQITFSTVSPSVTGSTSIEVDADGDIVDSAVWYDATAGDNSGFTQNLSSVEAVVVIGRDVDASLNTELDTSGPATYSLTGFGSDDAIYIDQASSSADNVYSIDTVSISNNGSAPTSLAFAGDDGQVVVNLTFSDPNSGDVVDTFLETENGTNSFEDVFGAGATPVISG